MSYTCPCCKTDFSTRKEHFPFCSGDCQKKDLGNWATGSYSIPAIEPPTEVELLKELGEELENQHQREN